MRKRKTRPPDAEAEALRGLARRQTHLGPLCGKLRAALRARDSRMPAAEDFRGADAEFDDYAEHDQPLGKLMAIAFGPYTPEDDDDGEGWYERIYRPFSDRYEFC